MAGLICNHCGQALSGTEKFCPNCGAKVESPQTPAAEPVMGFAKPAEPVAPETPEVEADSEPKAPEFHMDETFDWDLDGYPTGEKKVQDVEFNWGVEKAQHERPEFVVPEWSQTVPTAPREERKPLVDGLFEEEVTSDEASKDASALFGDEEAVAATEPAAVIPDEEIPAADILSEAGKAEGKRMDSFFATSAENESYQRTLDREFANLSTDDGADKEADAIRNLGALAALAQDAGETSGVKENDAEFEQRVEESANEFLRMIELEKQRADAALAEELNKNAAKTGAPAEEAEAPVVETPAEAPVAEAPDESEETVAVTAESSNGDAAETAEAVEETPVETPEVAEAPTAEATPETEEATAEETPADAETATEETAEAAENVAETVTETVEETAAETVAEEAAAETDARAEAQADALAKAMLASAVTANLTEEPTEEAVDAVESEIAAAETPEEPTDSFFRAAKTDTFATPKEEQKAAEETAATEETKAEENSKTDFGQIFEEEKKGEEAPVKKHTGLRILAAILVILIILELITIFLKYQMPDAAITIKIQSIYDSIYGTIYDFFHGIFG